MIAMPRMRTAPASDTTVIKRMISTHLFGGTRVRTWRTPQEEPLPPPGPGTFTRHTSPDGTVSYEKSSSLGLTGAPMGPTPKEQKRDLRLLRAQGQRLKQRQDEECCRECTGVHIRPYVQMQVHTVSTTCPTLYSNIPYSPGTQEFRPALPGGGGTQPGRLHHPEGAA